MTHSQACSDFAVADKKKPRCAKLTKRHKSHQPTKILAEMCKTDPPRSAILPGCAALTSTSECCHKKSPQMHHHPQERCEIKLFNKFLWAFHLDVFGVGVFGVFGCDCWAEEEYFDVLSPHNTTL